MKTWYYPSCGHGVIHAYRWQPEGEVKAIVQFVHGIAEHAGRYDAFAKELNARGILVVAEDHMGHGGSVGKTDVKGYFHGGWLSAVQDTHTLQQMIAREYPGMPYFLYGHSMGSFMTRTFLFRYPDSGLAGAILSGTAWQPEMVLRLGLAVCHTEGKKRGEQEISPLINKLMFGAYTKGLEDVQSPYDWLSRDRQVVRDYEADPMCGFDCTVGLGRDLMQGLQMIQDRKNLQKMDHNLPVLFLAGDRDPVGNNGKGVKRAFDAFCRCGMRDVQMKLYPNGRHEMHNEINKNAVYSDVISWIFEKL